MNKWQMMFYHFFFFIWSENSYLVTVRVTERFSVKGHLLNGFACIKPEFTGYEWMFISVLSTNTSAVSNNKTQLTMLPDGSAAAAQMFVVRDKIAN